MSRALADDWPASAASIGTPSSVVAGSSANACALPSVEIIRHRFIEAGHHNDGKPHQHRHHTLLVAGNATLRFASSGSFVDENAARRASFRARAAHRSAQDKDAAGATMLFDDDACG